MADSAAPPPVGLTQPQPKPKRFRRWPTAVVTCLLTLVAAYLLERYVLPTQGWWVAHNRSRYRNYLDEVLYSKSLPPAAKVELILEGVRSWPGNPYEPPGWLIQNMGYVLKAISTVLSDPNASTESLTDALLLLQVGVEICGEEGLSQKELTDIRETIRKQVCPPLNQLTNRPGLSKELRNTAVAAWSGIGTGFDLNGPTENEYQYYFPTDALIECLSDSNEDVRGNAARALGFVANGKDVPRVIAALLLAFEEEPTRPLIKKNHRIGDRLIFRFRIGGRLIFANDGYSRDDHHYDSWYALEPTNFARLEMVYSLGQYAGDAPESDVKLIHQTLLRLLTAPRPPCPPKVPSNHPDRGKVWADPWFDDQFLRAEAILALLPYRSRTKKWPANADSAVLATLKQWTPECPWTDYAVLAAAVYLGSCDHPDAVPTLLAVFREVSATCTRESDDWKKQEASRGDWATTPKARMSTLVTLMDALAGHPSKVPQLSSELSSNQPLFELWGQFQRPPFQTRLRSRTDANWPYTASSRWCLGPRVAWWRPVWRDDDRGWSLTRCLERVTPPAK